MVFRIITHIRNGKITQQYWVILYRYQLTIVWLNLTGKLRVRNEIVCSIYILFILIVSILSHNTSENTMQDRSYQRLKHEELFYYRTNSFHRKTYMLVRSIDASHQSDSKNKTEKKPCPIHSGTYPKTHSTIIETVGQPNSTLDLTQNYYQTLKSLNFQ